MQTLENAEQTTEVVAWVKKISSKEAGVVGNLIIVFQDQLEDIKLSNAILRTLRRMCDWVGEDVVK